MFKVVHNQNPPLILANLSATGCIAVFKSKRNNLPVYLELCSLREPLKMSFLSTWNYVHILKYAQTIILVSSYQSKISYVPIFSTVFKNQRYNLPVYLERSAAPGYFKVCTSHRTRTSVYQTNSSVPGCWCLKISFLSS